MGHSIFFENENGTLYYVRNKTGLDWLDFSGFTGPTYAKFIYICYKIKNGQHFENISIE